MSGAEGALEARAAGLPAAVALGEEMGRLMEGDEQDSADEDGYRSRSASSLASEPPGTSEGEVGGALGSSRAGSSRRSSRLSTLSAAGGRRPAVKKAPAARVGAIFKELVTTIKDSRNCLRRLQGRVVIDEGEDGFKSLALHRFRRLQTELHSLCISSRAACEEVERLAKRLPTDQVEELLALLDTVNDHHLSDYLRLLVYSNTSVSHGSVARRVAYMNEQAAMQKELRELERLSKPQNDARHRLKLLSNVTVGAVRFQARRKSAAWLESSNHGRALTDVRPRDRRVEFLKTHSKLSSGMTGISQMLSADGKEQKNGSLLFMSAEEAAAFTPLPESDDEKPSEPLNRMKVMRRRSTMRRTSVAMQAAEIRQGVAKRAALQRSLRLSESAKEAEKVYNSFCDSLKMQSSHKQKRCLDSEALVAPSEPLGPEGAVAIASLMRNSKVRWRSLMLNDTNLTPQSCAIIMRSVLENPTSRLRHLDLNGNSVGDAGASIISRLLDPYVEKPCECHLESLSLASNDILDTVIAHLFLALEKNKTLKKLNLSNNDADDRSASSLKAMLEVNSTLIDLDVSNAALAPDHIINSTPGLAANKTLMNLNLSGNRIGSSGGVILCKALEENTGLKSPNLSNCLISTCCVPEFEVMFQTNSTLNELNLTSNYFGTSSVRNLDLAKQRRREPLSLNLNQSQAVLGSQKPSSMLPYV